jgi:predicted phosphodiesterase
MRFVVVNDVHANSEALREFICDLSSLDFDKIIFLGDLLSYGVEVIETMELLVQMDNNYNCIFVSGNHEQIYFDYQKGREYQYKKFPKFLLESISDTASKLASPLEQAFNWVDYFVYKDVLFSHANLFKYGDWSYLNTERDFLLNYGFMNSMSLRGAIFGHTHRAKYKKYNYEGVGPAILDVPLGDDLCFFGNERFILTNGSLGQPRGSISSYLMCEINDYKVSVRSLPVSYDVSKHCQSIVNSELTVPTKEKLLNYFY